MLRKDMTKVEIEKELFGKGDYVQIDNITRFLKENLPMDLKRFLYIKLVGIYEKRRMFSEAAELYSRLIEVCLIPSDRVNYLTKAAEDYIRAGFFDKADLMTREVLGEARPNERPKISLEIKEFYKNQAKEYEKEKRRSMAVKTYEKILALTLSENEKTEINNKLLGLYKELGMMSQFMRMSKKV